MPTDRAAEPARADVAPDGRIWPDLPLFLAMARDRRVVPVVRRFLADGETPVSLYRRLARDQPGTFLLESAELDGTWSRYSFIGARSPAMLTERDGAAHWWGEVPVGLPTSGDPLTALRDTVTALSGGAIDGLPPFTGGLVGAITYDAVRHWERLPDSNAAEVPVPEIAMLLAGDVAVLDHADGTVWLIANAINVDGAPTGAEAAYERSCERLEQMAAALAGPAAGTAAAVTPDGAAEPRARTEPARYRADVLRAKQHIRIGDAFQIVLSQRFDVDCAADALDVYRVLRMTNPSPYMYLLRFPGTAGAGGFDVVGSSPEALVKVTDGRCMLHPIAGTRPRGGSAQEDADLAAELLADEKERAEHLMLVDLGRNDLGRVARPGSVAVVEFMAVERFSHVMHIVSTVQAQMADGITAYDVLAATFPAGTLSGAPKPRAMEIIDDLEPARRGLYGGAIGYFDFSGNLDTAIAIRTAVIRGGVAHVQAGAGIVADSDPAAEDAECRNKAAAVLRAIAAAHGLAAAAGTVPGSRDHHRREN